MEERTWFFGSRLTEQFEEPYDEDGYTLREVQYWEKGRRECTPAMVPGENDPTMLLSAMTLGLLATELMTGQTQVSHTQFEDREPSEVHVAGDPGAGPGLLPDQRPGRAQAPV
jgi:hypothetical protein